VFAGGDGVREDRSLGVAVVGRFFIPDFARSPLRLGYRTTPTRGRVAAKEILA
jgi:hypothetical protein